MAVLFYIITKVTNLEAFNFHGFASSVEIAKISCRRNFLILQYHKTIIYNNLTNRCLGERPGQCPWVSLTSELTCEGSGCARDGDCKGGQVSRKENNVQ